MAITIATIGRLMKNFDIARLVCGRLDGPRERLWIYRHSLANFLHALGDHALAGLHALADEPLITDPVAHGDGSNLDFIGGIYHGNLVTAL
jgi:hypothetical protein